MGRKYTIRGMCDWGRILLGVASVTIEDGRNGYIRRRQDEQWENGLVGVVAGPFPNADAAYSDLELRLAGEGVLLRRIG